MLFLSERDATSTYNEIMGHGPYCLFEWGAQLLYRCKLRECGLQSMPWSQVCERYISIWQDSFYAYMMAKISLVRSTKPGGGGGAGRGCS